MAAAGFHSLTVGDLSALRVPAFQLSKTRGANLDGLEEVVRRQTAADVTRSLWIAGSFLMQKIESGEGDSLLSFECAAEAARVTRT